MTIEPFALSRLPRIVFGAGRITEVPTLGREFGTRALLITGNKSLTSSPYWQPLLDDLGSHGMTWLQETIDGEPSPQWVDAAVARHRDAGNSHAGNSQA